MGTSTIIPSRVFLWNSKKAMKMRRGSGGASRFWLGVETILFYVLSSYQDMEY
jgi:hypothetical protein